MPFKQIASGILRPRTSTTENSPNFIGKITFTSAAGTEKTLPLAGWKKRSQFDGGGSYISVASSIYVEEEDSPVELENDVLEIIEENYTEIAPKSNNPTS